MRKLWRSIAAVVLLSSLAAAQNGKTGTFTWSWTPDSTITQVCSVTLTTQCADKFQLFQQLGSAPAPATDTLVGSPAITAFSPSYTFVAPNQPAGTDTFYALACIKDKAGTSICSVASAVTSGQFKPNPPNALSVAVS